MNTVQRIVKNTAAIFTAHVVVTILGLVLMNVTLVVIGIFTNFPFGHKVRKG